MAAATSARIQRCAVWRPDESPPPSSALEAMSTSAASEVDTVLVTAASNGVDTSGKRRRLLLLLLQAVPAPESRARLLLLAVLSSALWERTSTILSLTSTQWRITVSWTKVSDDDLGYSDAKSLHCNRKRWICCRMPAEWFLASFNFMHSTIVDYYQGRRLLSVREKKSSR